jgi:hypothetical protein
LPSSSRSPLAALIQRYLTTSADLVGTEFVSIEPRGNGRFFKVRTRRQVAEAA